MSQRYVKTMNADSLAKIFAELHSKGLHPIGKGGATSYYKPGHKGLFTVTHRLMFGGPEELKAKVEKCGFKVREANCNDFHTWVTFDVPTSFFKKEL